MWSFPTPGLAGSWGSLGPEGHLFCKQRTESQWRRDQGLHGGANDQCLMRMITPVAWQLPMGTTGFGPGQKESALVVEGGSRGLSGTKAGGEGTLEQSMLGETRSSDVRPSWGTDQSHAATAGRLANETRQPCRRSEGRTPRTVHKPCQGTVQDLKLPPSQRKEVPQTYPAPGAASDHNNNYWAAQGHKSHSPIGSCAVTCTDELNFAPSTFWKTSTEWKHL